MKKQIEFKLLEAAIKYAKEHGGDLETLEAFVAGASLNCKDTEGEEIIPQVLRTDDPEEVVTAIEIDGENYVRVHAGKYDFRIALHDAPDTLNWDDAKKYCEDKGMRLFTLEEGLLMFCFKDEINSKLVELGGEALREDEDYWSGTEYNRNFARNVGFSNGNANNSVKCSGCTVRPVAASKPCA